MTFDINSLPNDPQQLKQMLLELQERTQKELATKDKIITDQALQINQFIEGFFCKMYMGVLCIIDL